MRKAAAIIMLVFGVFTITVGLFILLQRESGATAQAWMRLALSVLLVAVGISVLKRRAYWWALLAAIAMVLVGTTDAVRAWQDPVFRHYLDAATRVLWVVSGWAFWAVPGLLTLVFLVKRKGEFPGKEVRQTATEEE